MPIDLAQETLIAISRELETQSLNSVSYTHLTLPPPPYV